MAQTYFLIEAINIEANVFDTDQLSIIRGSSFLLKQAILHIKNNFPSLHPISTGASTGLFRKINDDITDTALQDKIVKHLREDPNYQLFTFIVEHCQANELLQAKQQLLSQLRISQMQSIGIAPDNTATHQDFPCELDGKRYASTNLKATRQVQTSNNNEKKLSDSIYQRLAQGRKLKNDYYFKELKDKYQQEIEQIGLKKHQFSQDLETLANHENYAKLHNKIAVIYLDGNSFSKKQRDFIQKEKEQSQEQAQQDFDTLIQNKRNDYLINLLQNMVCNIDNHFPDAIADAQNPNELPIIRLETLLWGGDELTFVVPAWLGFEVLQNFYQEVEMKPEGEKKAFTHAAGIVFCHAKSPIRLMRQLANALADHNKNNYPDGREHNYWDYIILESIDYPTNNNIDDFFTQQYASLGIEKDRKPLRPAINWHKNKETLNKLIQDEQLSKGQLYKILQQVDKTEDSTASWDDLNQTTYTANTAQEKQEQQLIKISKGKLTNKLPKLAKDIFDLDINHPKQRLMFWVHLIETWDYLLPQSKGNQ